MSSGDRQPAGGTIHLSQLLTLHPGPSSPRSLRPSVCQPDFTKSLPCGCLTSFSLSNPPLSLVAAQRRPFQRSSPFLCWNMSNLLPLTSTESPGMWPSSLLRAVPWDLIFSSVMAHPTPGFPLQRFLGGFLFSDLYAARLVTLLPWNSCLCCLPGKCPLSSRAQFKSARPFPSTSHWFYRHFLLFLLFLT